MVVASSSHVPNTYAKSGLGTQARPTQISNSPISADSGSTINLQKAVFGELITLPLPRSPTTHTLNAHSPTCSINSILTVQDIVNTECDRITKEKPFSFFVESSDYKNIINTLVPKARATGHFSDLANIYIAFGAIYIGCDLKQKYNIYIHIDEWGSKSKEFARLSINQFEKIEKLIHPRERMEYLEIKAKLYSLQSQNFFRIPNSDGFYTSTLRARDTLLKCLNGSALTKADKNRLHENTANQYAKMGCVLSYNRKVGIYGNYYRALRDYEPQVSPIILGRSLDRSFLSAQFAFKCARYHLDKIDRNGLDPVDVIRLQTKSLDMLLKYTACEEQANMGPGISNLARLNYGLGKLTKLVQKNLDSLSVLDQGLSLMRLAYLTGEIRFIIKKSGFAFLKLTTKPKNCENKWAKESFDLLQTQDQNPISLEIELKIAKGRISDSYRPKASPFYFNIAACGYTSDWYPKTFKIESSHGFSALNI